jgi:hypothetical protein
MSARIQKRIALTGALLNDFNADEQASRPLQYEVDRRGSTSKRRRLLANEASASVAPLPTLLGDRKKPSTNAELAVLKRVSAKNLSLESKSSISEATETVDIWGPQSDALCQPRASSKAIKVVKLVPNAALSYNPSFDQHQGALAEALAIELRKREKDSNTTQLPTVPPMVSTAGNLDEEDSDEDDSVDGEDKAPRGLSRRQKEGKLTRAQRNRIRSRNIAGFEASIAKSGKDILKSIDNLPAILKELEREEQLKETEAQLRALKAEPSVETMSYEEAGLVPLSDELRGSLRSLVPRGVLVKTLESDMRGTGKLMSRARRAKKTKEAPFGAKRIKWVARHKYP